MVDLERLTTILARITARLAILDEYADEDPAVLLPKRRWLGDLKYTFQTTIEACTDAAQHVVASEGLGAPSSNADAFTLLATAGFLDHDLAERLGSAVGFRNVLVHDYAEVDPQQVVDNLAHREDLRAFVAAMTQLLT